jgi:hypothetical protein
MKNPLIFVSTCPSCALQQLQHGHTRRALTKLIESREIIDAYCLECDVVWPVTAEERALIACAISTPCRQPGVNLGLGTDRALPASAPRLMLDSPYQTGSLTPTAGS